MLYTADNAAIALRQHDVHQAVKNRDDRQLVEKMARKLRMLAGTDSIESSAVLSCASSHDPQPDRW